MSSKQVDLAVVGGGLAGLLAAAHAANSGLSVEVIERNKSLGGRARTTNRSGFRLNQGAHAFYVGGRGAQHLAAVGVRPKAWTPPTSGLVRAAGELTQLPSCLEAVLKTKALGIKGKLEFAKLMGELPKLDPADFASVTLRDFIEARVSRDDTAALVEMFARLTCYSTDLDAMSTDGYLEMTHLALASGVRYLHRGWASMVAELSAAAAQRGAQFSTGNAVDMLDATPGGFSVCAGDEQIHSRSLLIACGSPNIAAALAGGIAPELKRYADQARPVQAACLDLCLDERPKARFAMAADAPLYWSEHAPAADLAPDGSSLVHTLRYGTSNAKNDRAELEDWAAQVFPTWRDHVVHEQFLAHIAVAGDIPQAATGGLVGRPPVEVPECQGLLVAGDWVGKHGLLSEASLSSGAEAARLAISACKR